MPTAGLLAPHEAPDLQRQRSEKCMGAPRLKVGRGGPRDGALIEARRRFKPADIAPPEPPATEKPPAEEATDEPPDE